MRLWSALLIPSEEGNGLFLSVSDRRRARQAILWYGQTAVPDPEGYIRGHYNHNGDG